MTASVKKLPKSTVEITVELTVTDMQPYLERGAAQMARVSTIPGFRPGKAPYGEVVARFGAGRIWEEAANLAVPRALQEVLAKNNLETIGSPSIDVIKLAPDNPFIFKTKVALMPEVATGDYSSIKVARRPVEVKEEAADRALDDLRKMQTKEVVADRASEARDKVVLDMTMALDTVPLEGGNTKDHAVYMDEEYYVPGFKAQIQGLKKGDIKEFQLAFPKDHYQKMIAGRDVDFKVTIKDVFALQRPALDDAFAESLGQKNLGGLRTLVARNLEAEAEDKEAQRYEIELLEKVLERTKIGDIPDILVNEETLKMVDELGEGVERQGLEFNEYLKKIGKTREGLRLEFAPEALKRVKVALTVRKIASDRNIKVGDAEVDAEVARVLETYKNAPEMREQIKSPEAREYLRGMLRNRKVIEYLKGQVK